jgi:hypothetical protein
MAGERSILLSSQGCTRPDDASDGTGLADDAAGKFPFIREIIGNFAIESAWSALYWRQNKPRFSGLVKIPCESETGNFWSRTGTFYAR